MCENSACTNTLFLCLHTRGGDVKRFNYKTLKRGSISPKSRHSFSGGDPAARLFLETCKRSLCCPKSGGLMVIAVKF